VLELLNILSYTLPSLGQLEEFHLLRVPHTVGKVLISWVSKLSFGLIWTLVCAKFIDHAVKTRIKHKRLCKNIILNEEFTKN